ncbi:MAG: hypothetical protein EB120_03905 [Proteobacteria bacterium]|nr:hypothetical protein [Pseudomonadota bacterium]
MGISGTCHRRIRSLSKSSRFSGVVKRESFRAISSGAKEESSKSSLLSSDVSGRFSMGRILGNRVLQIAGRFWDLNETAGDFKEKPRTIKHRKWKMPFLIRSRLYF